MSKTLSMEIACLCMLNLSEPKGLRMTRRDFQGAREASL